MESHRGGDHAKSQLFNAILADLYGPQRLLRDRMLPPELVFSNPAFLRPCRGIHPPGGAFLHMYSADLAHVCAFCGSPYS